MSLEAAIAETNTLLRELIQLQRGTKVTTAPDGESGRVSVGPHSAAEQTKPAKPAVPTAVVPRPTPAPEAVQLTYDEVGKFVTKLAATKGREGAIKLLGEVQEGAKKLPDIKPENYAALVERVKQALVDAVPAS